jgi:hypothetical protein
MIACTHYWREFRVCHVRRFSDVNGDKPDRFKFEAFPTGYFHVQVAEMRAEQGKIYVLVAT